MLALLTPLLSGQMKLFFVKVLGDAGVLGNARDLKSFLVPGDVLVCTPSENRGRLISANTEHQVVISNLIKASLRILMKRKAR